MIEISWVLTAQLNHQQVFLTGLTSMNSQAPTDLLSMVDMSNQLSMLIRNLAKETNQQLYQCPFGESVNLPYPKEKQGWETWHITMKTTRLSKCILHLGSAHAGTTDGTCGSDMDADTICYDVVIDIRSYQIVKIHFIYWCSCLLILKFLSVW